MKRPAPTLPPQAEWDFRQIEDLALPDATLWEYARQSPKLRTAICRWYDTRADGSTLRTLIRRGWWRRPPTGEARSRRGALRTAAIVATGNLRLAELIALRPDFPAPWTARPLKYRINPDSIVRVSCQTFEKCLDSLAAAPTHVRDGVLRARRGHYMVRIDWAAGTVQEIIADLSRWVRREAANHPERQKTGKPSQAPVDPLKWLAALRLKQAGFTFEAAQDAIADHNDGGRLMPYYIDESSWARAVKRAKTRLAEIESGSLDALSFLASIGVTQT